MGLFERLPKPILPRGQRQCTCSARDPNKPLRLIVLTGGPGAGKTAVLLALREIYCPHVAVIPEAATILFKGGFPRHDTIPGQKAAQRAIFHVQREAERLVDDEMFAHTAFCDRGTVDSQAYWPGQTDEFWRALKTSRQAELERYLYVLHLRTPTADDEYNQNALRYEDIKMAHEIDERILMAWEGHSNRVIIPSTPDFQTKLTQSLAVIKKWVPPPT